MAKAPKQKPEAVDAERVESVPPVPNRPVADRVPENPRKAEIYETFKVWESMPAIAKKLIRDSADEKKLAGEGLTDDDLQIFALANIRNRQEFSEQFGVDPDTLTAWGKKLYASDDYLDGIKTWAKRLSKNVVMALYKNAAKKGGSFEAKLWFQNIDGWSEKQRHEHEFVPIGSVTIETIPKRVPAEELSAPTV